MALELVLYDFDGVLADSIQAHLDFAKDLAQRFDLAGVKIPSPEEVNIKHRRYIYI
jgi:phosphoglycolate phosphatase-like HAD superfamily hydrolase